MDIRILPSNIANMIAAGEVVQRPASVVKELMENALDAGSNQITVIIKDSGRTLVQVIDNGCGMSPDEAVLCFERHATSKIATADDLSSISTFGFRGEALASIAAVAEVTLRTRREVDELGCQVEFADSKHIDTVECSAPVGTSFFVRNLFYNVPARRKFLKSDNVEFKHIVEEFSRIVLTRPDVGFTLIHNDKEIYNLKKTTSFKYRIKDLFGSNAVDKVVDINVETTIAKVDGYICRPDLAKKTLGEQYFFVNGRYFRSPYLHKAVMKAYEDMISDGATPSYFIYLSVAPHTIDVNIHPTKTEIKFEEDSVVFQILYACVRESLGRHSFGASIDFEQDGEPEMPVFSNKYEEFRPDLSAPVVSHDPNFNPFEPDASVSEGYSSRGQGNAFAGGRDFPQHREQDYGMLWEDKTLPTTSVLAVQGKYILTQVQSGILVINIKRARERILYEKFLKAISKNEHISQASLFPVSVTVGVENRLIFEEHAELLSALGFDISSFGNDEIVVNGLPEGFKNDAKSVEALMADVLLILNEESSVLAGVLESAMAGKFARIGAANSAAIGSNIEAQRLIDTLFACENSEFTDKGLKIMAILSIDEIDKKF